MTTSERLRLHAAVLETIDRRRREGGDANLGAAIEDRILTEELGELEADLLSNQIPLEAVPVLAPRKLGERRGKAK